MKTYRLAVLLTALCYFFVPSAMAAPHLYEYFLSDTDSSSSPVEKRKGVDAWSICPPQMTDVDCFYAYLRVYARLRQAAEESDRVSMRNIGKRSELTPSLEEERAKTRTRLMQLCPEDMSPLICYDAANRIFDRVIFGVNL